MAHYENRLPPEGINVSRESAGLVFLKLLTVAVVLVVVLVIAATLMGGAVAKRVPFHYEERLMESLQTPLANTDLLPGKRAGFEKMSQWLETLVAELKPLLPVEEGMNFHVNFSCDDTFNAFATLGGQMVFNRGLLRRLPNENAVAMVVAHEMAHVIHRDPIAGLGGGLASMTALLMVTGFSSSSATNLMLGDAGALTRLSFNRDMEYRADETGLAAIAARYGHTQGADSLFRLLGQVRGNASGSLADARQRVEEFASTHPLDDSRIEALQSLSAENGWRTEGRVTALPPDFRDWMAGCLTESPISAGS